MSDIDTIRSMSSCALNSCPGMILALHEIHRLRVALGVRAPDTTAAMEDQPRVPGSSSEMRYTPALNAPLDLGSELPEISRERKEVNDLYFWFKARVTKCGFPQTTISATEYRSGAHALPPIFQPIQERDRNAPL